MNGRQQSTCGWLLAGAMLTAASTAGGEVVMIPPSRDGTLYQETTGSLANGQGHHLFTGRTDQPNALSRRRTVLYFNLTGFIPPNATIHDVRLTLYMSRTDTSSATVTLHRLLTDWGEGASDAPGEEGGGAPSQPGDATWIHTFYDSSTWSTPGGDYVSTPSASRIIIGIGPYTWGTTTDLVADVQNWVDNPSTNHGWILVGPELFGGSAKRFDSRENPTPAQRPVLRVEFTPPIPATSVWGLIVLAILTLSAGTLGLRRMSLRTRRPAAI